MRKLRHIIIAGKPQRKRASASRNRLAGLQPMELDWRVAAALGAGLTDDAIVAELGVERKTIRRVRRDIPGDPDLARIAEEARTQVVQQAVEGAKKALQRMIDSLDGYVVSAGKGQVVRVDCQPQQAAAVWDRLAKATGLDAPPKAEEEATLTDEIDFEDPKVRVQVLQALQKSALEAEKQKKPPEEREIRALPAHTEVA